MRTKKNYLQPKAEITVFECAEIITTSLTPTSRLLDKPDGAIKSYVQVGQQSWTDALK